MFATFGRTFFQTSLPGYFLKLLNKQACLLLLNKEKTIKAGRFLFQDELFISNELFISRDLALSKRNPA